MGQFWWHEDNFGVMRQFWCHEDNFEVGDDCFSQLIFNWIDDDF